MSDDLKRRLEEEADRAPIVTPDLDRVLRGGRRRRRARMLASGGAAALVVGVAAFGASALEGSRLDPPVVAPSPQPSQSEATPGTCSEGPAVELSPKSAEVGQRVQMTGRCFPEDQRTSSEREILLTATVRYGPVHAPPGRDEVVCEVIASDGGVARIEDDGTMTGFFIVPQRGTCFGERHMKSVPMRQGEYMLAIGCRTCHVGAFRIEPPPTPATISLQPLPPQGFVVGEDEGVTFVSVEGERVDRLEDYELATGADSTYVLLRGPGGSFYELDSDDSAVHQISRLTFGEQSGSHSVPSRDLGVPPGARAKDIGRSAWWLYNLDRDDGVTLAQWSDSCPMPTAFWIAPGAEPQIVTGESSLDEAHPESTALGWSAEGEAFVHIGSGSCGSAGDPPGVYGFSAPGSGRLIYEVPPGARVGMWPDRSGNSD